MSSDNQNWVLGITLGLLGSIAINTGNNIQSLGLKNLSQEKVEPESSALVSPNGRQRASSSSLPSLPWRSPAGKNTPKLRRSMLWSPTPTRAVSNESEEEFDVVRVSKSPAQSVTWVVGTIVFVTGSLLNFASYAFAAQSMLASLESIQFVTNLIFGKVLLGATVTQTMMAGTCLTVTGTVMAVQFSSKETYELNTSDMIKLYQNPAYVTYLVLIGAAVAILHFVYKRLNEMKTAGKPVKRSDVMMPCIYSVSSALFGTQSTVQAKVLAELLAVQTSGAENIFSSWFTYVTLIAWAFTAMVWLKRLNGALKIFNPLFIIPLLQCSFIFFAIVSGGIFFKEFNAFSISQWMGFWFGILVMFSGLVLLTPAPQSHSKDDELHRELVNLLLESQARSHSNLTVERTPRTPCHSLESNIDAARASNVRDKQEQGSGKSRSPRISKENLANAALDALGAMTEVLSGDPRARALSEAMVLNTTDEEDRRRRRTSLERLLKMIKENPISMDGYNEEISGLIKELKLDVQISPAPGPDIRDVARHLSMTQDRLQNQILKEIEQNRTPKVAEAAGTPVARDLAERFNKPTPT